VGQGPLMKRLQLTFIEQGAKGEGVGMLLVAPRPLRDHLIQPWVALGVSGKYAVEKALGLTPQRAIRASDGHLQGAGKVDSPSPAAPVAVRAQERERIGIKPLCQQHQLRAAMATIPTPG